MSRLKLRKETNCLNCNTETQGPFCHNCGQENVETKETVWYLVSHFFKDITHFDGKFFSTIKYLFARPGFLSTEYMIGRRASYVNPIRLYVFTSAFFFLIFFSFMNVEERAFTNGTSINGKTYAQTLDMDSASFAAFTKGVNEEFERKPVPMTREELRLFYDSLIMNNGFKVFSTRYPTRAAYDSAVNSGRQKHNWLQRQLVYKEIELNERYGNNADLVSKAYISKLVHSLPQMFFILLPLFALILKLLYYRRKDFYYVNHSIFSIHFYIFSFLTMLLMFALGKLNNLLDWGLITFIQVLMGFGMLFYLYKSMRKFYRQRRGKTILKFLILCLLLFVTMALLFFIFILYSYYKL
jgi:Protein of unknown function (DUF3667)